jgi:hypothetical protein
MTLRRWAPRAAFGIYGLLLLAATVRAWLKFDVETAGKLFGLGLVFGVVLWRSWRYVVAALFGSRPKSRGARLPTTNVR